MYLDFWFFIFLCSGISCGSPGTIVNGTEVVNEGFLYEDTITYQCDLGYEQSAGDTSVTCQADGSWSGATLECASESPLLCMNGCLSGEQNRIG